MMKVMWGKKVLCLVGSLFMGAVAMAQLAPPPTVPTLGSKEIAQSLPPLGGFYAYKAALQKNVQENRVEVLQAYLSELSETSFQNGGADGALWSAVKVVSAVDIGNAGFFDVWVEKYPHSYLGPLARAYFELHHAWKARGNKFMGETKRTELVEMDRWLGLVRRDALLALSREPRCGICYTALIQFSMPWSLNKEAQEWFNQGMGVAPQSVSVPNAFHYSLTPKWGGSLDAQRALVQKLQLAGHESVARSLTADMWLEQYREQGPTDPAMAQQTLKEVETMLAVAPNYGALLLKAFALKDLGRLAEADQVLTKLVEGYDADEFVYQLRSYVYVQQQRWPEAVRDLRVAYDQFLSKYAFEWLVRLSAGNAGVPFRTSPSEFPALCKEAALRGLPIAMTCLGGLHFFGTGGVAKDLVQARQWFQRAADAGDAQGMMDLAQMCLTGQGGTADRSQAIRLWIAAAALEHPHAKAKVENELSFGERFQYVQWPQMRQRLGGWWRVVAAITTVYSK